MFMFISLLLLVVDIASAMRARVRHCPTVLMSPVKRVENLPARLLSDQLRLFCVEAEDLETGQRRVFTVDAKHVGAAQTKAWRWGFKVRHVEAVTPNGPVPTAELAD